MYPGRVVSSSTGMKPWMVMVEGGIILYIYLSMYPGREGCNPGILYNWYETMDGDGSGWYHIYLSIHLSIYVSR